MAHTLGKFQWTKFCFLSCLTARNGRSGSGWQILEGDDWLAPLNNRNPFPHRRIRRFLQAEDWRASLSGFQIESTEIPQTLQFWGSSALVSFAYRLHLVILSSTLLRSPSAKKTKASWLWQGKKIWRYRSRLLTKWKTMETSITV